MKCGDAQKLFVFDERENYLDPNRSRVITAVATHTYYVPECTILDHDFFHMVGASLFKEQSAELVQQACLSIIKSNYSDHAAFHNAQCIGFAEEIKEFQQRAKKSAARHIVMTTDASNSNGCILYSEPDSDLLDELLLSPEDYPEEQLFLEFCCHNVYSLFCKMSEDYEVDEITAEHWLAQYVDACDEYARSSFRKGLSYTCIAAIRDSFISCEVFPDELQSDELYFDSETLAEAMQHFYFD